MARRFNQFRQERYNVDYWIEYVTTDNDICCKSLGSILPDRLNNGDICEALSIRVLAQITQHCSIWFNGGNMPPCRGKCQQKPARSGPHIQHARMSSYYILESAQ